MVNFSVAQIRTMMDEQESIRNISVIAHVDHGKSTLTDSLIGKAGIIADARQGEARFMDTRDDEQARSITIKSTCVSLYYNKKMQDGTTKPFLINLIDSPGHVDFSSEVTAALRVTDGALVVVDCIEGVCVQTETVLRQAILERIKPILFVNKLDRIFLELAMTPEEAFKCFRNSIESVNVIVETYNDESLGDIQVNPEVGRVGFGSGLHAWGFTLRDFAEMYENKFGLTKEKLMKKFWGNNCWHPILRKWVKHDPVNNPYSKGGAEPINLERGFCQFVMKPMVTLFDAIKNKEEDVYWPIIEALNLKLTHEERDLVTKPLLKVVMRRWIPAGDALLDMIVEHLPSPVVAQAYRCEILYSGDLEDSICDAIRTCDPKGELSMYVSKMCPTSEKGRFIAFGRVFSGTVKTGQTVRIYGPDYKRGKKRDLYVKKVQRTLLMMGRYVEQLPDCPCGNLVSLVGIDQYLLKSGTVTTCEEALPFVTMKFSVSAVVQIAVEACSAQDLPKLVEGLKRLSKSDPLVKTYTAKTGEHIIAGAGELHLEICLKDLQEQYMRGAKIRVSEPVVSYCEGISQRTGSAKPDGGDYPDMVVAKSPNKHNRLYIWAEPVMPELCQAIDDGEIKWEDDFKTRARILANEYGWQVGDARKIWSFGCPPDATPNFLVDAAKGVQFLNEIKDHFVGAFMQVSGGGVLCDEMWRGVRINIDDVTLHADAIHRGAGQIMPCAKKCLYACQIASGPILYEPMYLVDITVPSSALSGVYRTLNARRGAVDTMVERVGTPLVQIRAFLPVAESFGFTQMLRQKTAGQAFPQMKFDHWARANGNPLVEGSQANEAIKKIRERKGLKLELPEFMDYYDRI